MEFLEWRKVEGKNEKSERKRERESSSVLNDRRKNTASIYIYYIEWRIQFFFLREEKRKFAYYILSQITR